MFWTHKYITKVVQKDIIIVYILYLCCHKIDNIPDNFVRPMLNGNKPLNSLNSTTNKKQIHIHRQVVKYMWLLGVRCSKAVESVS